MLLAAALAFAVSAEPRDPFASLNDVVTVEAKKPAQRFAVDAMKLQAVVDTASPRALVALPDGTVLVVRVHDELGDRGGVITSIHGGRVVVREDIHNAIGEHFVANHVLTTH